MSVHRTALLRRIHWLAASLLLLPAGAAHACSPLPADAAQALSLETVLARVPACHPSVREAFAAAGIAAADMRTAAQGANPQLTLGAGSVGRDLGRGSLWNKTFDHQIRVDQLIERGDKPLLRRESAAALGQAAEADRAEALRAARLEAASAYVDLAAALALQQQTAQSASLADESLQAMRLRVRAGDVAPLDETRFALDAARLQAELSQATGEVRAARLQLAGLIGAESRTDQLIPVAQAVEQIPLPRADAMDAPIDGRPGVAAAQARVDAARRGLALARAQQTRDVNVGAQFSRYPVSATNSSGTGNTVSLSITVQLFVRHAFEGEIARAAADLAAAEEALRRTRLAALTEVTRARSQWQSAQERDRWLTGQVMPAAEQVAAGAELAYRRGASGVLDVLDARRNLRAARIERIHAETERAKAALQLDAALQVPGPATP